MSTGSALSVAFGSRQPRRMFPTHLPQNRLGVEVLRPETTRLGPGCYDNHEFGTMQHNMRSKPGSRRGYGPSARTAARFASLSRDVTPSPQQYQPDQSRSTLPPVGRAPFSSSTPRFRTQQQTGQEGPGPGTYNLHAETNRKVSWPMRFGRPDRTTLPPLDRHSMEGAPWPPIEVGSSMAPAGRN